MVRDGLHQYQTTIRYDGIAEASVRFLRWSAASSTRLHVPVITKRLPVAYWGHQSIIQHVNRDRHVPANLKPP
jgi:hypothetical protein